MKTSSLFLIFSLFSLDAYSRDIPPESELNRLFQKFDTDNDKKITVDDKIPEKASFELKSTPKIKASGVYELSNLAQELKWSQINNSPLKVERIQENPVDRISRSIREIYWDGLTRKIDASTLDAVIVDPKVKTDKKYLYVPHDDVEAFKFYSGLKRKYIEVVKLPKKIPKGYINSIRGKQGLLTLAMNDGEGVPYVVPGGRFNEMYGWDSYFHVLGTLADARIDLAKGMADNFIYQINHYGKILNANRTYYLSRSQPPFFSSIIREVYSALPEKTENKAWLKTALKAALKEYNSVWMGEERLTNTGLSRYAGFDQGIPPEVEEGHFDAVLKPYAKKHNMSVDELQKKFNEGKIKDPELVDFFHQDRAVRESGHDTTYRWRVGVEDRASDFVTVDLNSLLYKYELDLAHLIEKHFDGKFEGVTSSSMYKAAGKRKDLIRKYLWDPEKNFFFDYNWKTKSPSSYISATALYPLWATAGHPESYNLLTKEESRKLVKNAMNSLEEKGGLAATAEESLSKVEGREKERQWDYPNGWAPHQILAWNGLMNYGFKEDAKRLVYKWLYMITKNARDYNGTIPEKYDVENRSHKVFAEYGNVGTDFSYITQEGFGWMNASYQLGLKILDEEKKEQLRKLTPPEKL